MVFCEAKVLSTSQPTNIAGDCNVLLLKILYLAVCMEQGGWVDLCVMTLQPRHKGLLGDDTIFGPIHDARISLHCKLDDTALRCRSILQVQKKQNHWVASSSKIKGKSTTYEKIGTQQSSSVISSNTSHMQGPKFCSR